MEQNVAGSNLALYFDFVFSSKFFSVKRGVRVLRLHTQVESYMNNLLLADKRPFSIGRVAMNIKLLLSKCW